jgi:protein TonB
MFEQAVLPPRPTGRWWAVGIGLVGETFVLAAVLIAPLIWPQLLPRAAMPSWISLPAPRQAAKTPLPAHIRPMPTIREMFGQHLIQPATIPNRVAMIDDPPAQPPGVEGGFTAAEVGRFALAALEPAMRPAPPQRAAEPATDAPSKPVPAAPPRRISAVQPARVIHRVELIYPAIARQARISGTVELKGVIGTDGRIRELHLVKGHPLLGSAALDAVRQWVYEPTLLNCEPVEVIAPITVTFRLN